MFRSSGTDGSCDESNRRRLQIGIKSVCSQFLQACLWAWTLLVYRKILFLEMERVEFWETSFGEGSLLKKYCCVSKLIGQDKLETSAPLSVTCPNKSMSDFSGGDVVTEGSGSGFLSDSQKVKFELFLFYISPPTNKPIICFSIIRLVNIRLSGNPPLPS